MPSQIEGGRWDTWFRRYFSIKTDSIAPEVSDFIQPTLPLPFGLEQRFLITDKLVIGRASSPAIPGQFSRIVLNNPTGSGHLITDIEFLNQVANIFGVYPAQNQTIGVSTLAQIRVVDNRWGPMVLAPHIGELFLGSVAVPLSNAPMVYPATTPGQWVPLNVVLWAENNNTSSVTFEGSIANEAIAVSLKWREILIEPSWNA